MIAGVLGRLQPRCVRRLACACVRVKYTPLLAWRRLLLGTRTRSHSISWLRFGPRHSRFVRRLEVMLVCACVCACMCVCVHVCVCVRVWHCVRACVRACGREGVRACLCWSGVGLSYYDGGGDGALGWKRDSDRGTERKGFLAKAGMTRSGCLYGLELRILKYHGGPAHRCDSREQEE